MVMELVCIVCPVSCNLEVVMEDGKIKEIKGAGCKRGVKYAEEETICPKRTLTTTIRTTDNRMVPVRSDKPLPKDRVFEVMEKINKVKCVPPVRIGDIILEKVYEDVNIIATRNIG
jgi:CxxC motif-containing protein